MASSQQKKNLPRFFRNILSSTLQTGKMGIPTDFVRKYGNDLSSPAILRVPTGAIWEVELVKSNGILWLKNGWKEFSNHFSLKYGQFLVFRYEGNSSFHVTIFDSSKSEIVYPHTRLSEEEEESEDDDTEEEESEDDDSEEEESEDDDSTQRKKPRSTRTKKDKRACEDEPNPFFEVEMSPDYIEYPGRKMCIPKDFSTKYLKKGCSRITLTVGEKTWPAMCSRYVSRGKYTKAVIYSGWNKFRENNNLKVGDTCVFELTNRTETSFNVKYRSSLGSRSGSSLRPLTPCEKARAFLRVGDFISKRPFFKVVMQPAYLKCARVNIPYKFINNYLGGKKGQVSLQDPDERTWTVELSIGVNGDGQHKAHFCSTWKDFVMGNNLQVGDLCIFELIGQKKRLFKVSIFLAASSSNATASASASASTSASISPQGL